MWSALSRWFPGPTCPRCQGRLRREWTICPYCGLSSGASPAPVQPVGAQPTCEMPPGVAQGPIRPEPGERLAWLVPLDGPQRGTLLRCGGGQHIGSGADCDIRIQDAAISGHHARLSMDAEGRFYIHDEGSRNGVFVNGERVQFRELVDGDRLQLGRTRLCFKMTI